ncbi:hypothetical protein [Microbacterium sp. cx-59]|uniref:hypothetical protein n=1 Tax=Microbacterium sp. cx-59 TaxID=2891207 RepID=UPI001E5E5DE6|nr:hypothetical protein [Microbacterium sp. cx-59]MCC4908880.1 hypothetical protein [Microbacterium sp. cx-59]
MSLIPAAVRRRYAFGLAPESDWIGSGNRMQTHAVFAVHARELAENRQEKPLSIDGKFRSRQACWRDGDRRR